jgi:predicted dehydrogenase
MRRARIGIIGVGWWGTVGHLEPLSKDEKAEVVAVYSRTEEKARERAERYGVPKYYSDYRRMIEENRLDGVIIATTPNMHYEQARFALEHGLHVLMEKPFVFRAEEAEELARIAQEKGLLLSVCYPQCFHPWLVEARQQIREGKLGNLLLMMRTFSQRVYDLYKGDVSGLKERGEDYPVPNPTSYSDPNIVGGGQGHTQATHTIGELLYVCGLRPVSVFAYMNNLDLPFDVVDVIAVRFANGALATIGSSGLVPPRMVAFGTQIIGDKGLFALDSTRWAAKIWLEGEPAPRDLAQPEHRNLAAEVPRNFVRAILGEEELHIPTQVAVDTVKILDAAYRSAKSGQVVEIH